MNVRRAIVCILVGASLLASWLQVPPTAYAQQTVVDFEQFQEGEILGPASLGAGIVISEVTNNTPEHPSEVIIFDSDCPGGCSGNDPDLQTPGFGVGNTIAQHKILIIAQDVADRSPADGLVDDPNDEGTGGSIRFSLDPPQKVLSMRILDVESYEADGRLVISRLDGSDRAIAFALLDDGSAQTVRVADPQIATAFTVFFEGSGAVDDIILALPCGDGVVDEGEECDDGNTIDDDCCRNDCTAAPPQTPCDDSDECTLDTVCDGFGQCSGGMSPCGDGVVQSQCGEECDDGASNGSGCCDAACGFEPQGHSCESDGNICTDDFCDGAGACTHPPNQSPCSDGDACTVDDVCAAGSCVPGQSRVCDDANECTDDFCDSTSGCFSVPDDENECVDGACIDGVCITPGGCLNDAGCDDGNPCTDDVCLPTHLCDHTDNTAPCEDGNACTEGDVCSLGACTPGEPKDCNDDNICTDDLCDQSTGCINSPNTLPCDDGLFCNGFDSCADGLCTHEGDPCLDEGACSQTCIEEEDICRDPVQTPCDDLDPCTTGSLCDGEGTCLPGESVCGDGIVQPECDEQCDPLADDGCDDMCQFIPVCGNGSLEPGEECDDANDDPADGCDQCDLEGIVCFEGSEPAPSIAARRIALESQADYAGGNADGNQEIFLFDLKSFEKLVGKGMTQFAAVDASMTQLTDTASPVENEQPTVNGNARFVAFVSNGSLASDPGNPEGNREIFQLDRKRSVLEQITDSSAADNLHPALRASKGRFLWFDSAANLVPGICVGSQDEFLQCTTDADCPAGLVCGNPEANREVFRWLRRARIRRGVSNQLRQLTATPTGMSIVGNSVNFFTRATAFASSGDPLGSNADGGREIFRIIRKFSTLTQITNVPSGLQTAESPSQARKNQIAFSSDADLVPGGNPDGNMEIFLWSGGRGGSATIRQITNTTGCANGEASIDAFAKFIAFQSTCDLIPSSGNPDQSCFIFDLNLNQLLDQLVLRGPGSSPCSRPIVSRKVRTITYEADPGPGFPNVVCIFSARKNELLTAIGN